MDKWDKLLEECEEESRIEAENKLKNSLEVNGVDIAQYVVDDNLMDALAPLGISYAYKVAAMMKIDPEAEKNKVLMSFLINGFIHGMITGSVTQIRASEDGFMCPSCA